MIVPAAAENWIQVITNVLLDGGPAESDPFPVSIAIGNSFVASIGFELRLRVTGAVATDVLAEVFSVPDADAALACNVAADSRILACSSVATWIDNFWIDWQTVVSGAKIKLTRVSAVNGKTANAWIRRYRMADVTRR